MNEECKKLIKKQHDVLYKLMEGYLFDTDSHPDYVRLEVPLEFYPDGETAIMGNPVVKAIRK